MTLKQKELLVAWVEGRHALGWRGWLAHKLLMPVVNEVLAKTNKKITL